MRDSAYLLCPEPAVWKPTLAVSAYAARAPLVAQGARLEARLADSLKNTGKPVD